MELGIIGTGNIGSMLARAWLASGQVERIHLCNRSADKVEALASTCGEGAVVHRSPEELVRAVSWVIVCVKVEDARTLLPTIAPLFPDNGLLVSTNSALSLCELESIVPCYVAKLIPSVTQEVGAGALLVMPSARLSKQDAPSVAALRALWGALQAIGSPYAIPEESLRVYSDMTSCGPAFLAQWLASFAQSAASRGVPLTVAQSLLADMAYGVGKLCQSGYRLEDITARVAVPGGVTSAGLQVLDDASTGVFDRLLEATAQRQADIAKHGHR
ncbi:MAG: NAD(P)-binding domain-containing protein [Firmicutes bacterium]|nr:NAD(P)-binding domain-containing protein [Bacillota bacterium]